jgi:hypothetical protein
LMEQLGLTPAAVVETVERLFPVHRS